MRQTRAQKGRSAQSRRVTRRPTVARPKQAKERTASREPFSGKRYRLFVLGAGFSRLAGLPLGLELWQEVRRRARRLEGRAGIFERDLQTYVQYKNDCFGITVMPEDVDFEGFLRFLDIEHFLGMRGSDTWSRAGNEATVLVKTLIGQILSELTPPQNRIPPLYLTFAKSLLPDDHVLTFNYDILLERALDAVGKPYRLFPSRYTSVGDYASTVDDSRQEVILLKLHGSIDWFDRTDYSWLERQRRRGGFAGNPPDPVFANVKELGVSKLVDGPRSADDPLDQMYRVRDIERLYSQRMLFHSTPWLLAPSPAKILYASTLRDFWRGIGLAEALNFGLSIIGYSLPPQDEYARQVLHAIVTNYQGTNWGKDYFGLRKQPLVIVDSCPDSQTLAAFRARYRFVNWDRAVLFTNGLNEDAVNCVLASV